MAGSDRRRNRLSKPEPPNARPSKRRRCAYHAFDEVGHRVVADDASVGHQALGQHLDGNLVTDWPSETASLMLLSPISTPVYVLPMRRVFLSARCISCQNNPAYHVRMVGPANSVNAVAAAMAGPNGIALVRTLSPSPSPSPGEEGTENP